MAKVDKHQKKAAPAPVRTRLNVRGLIILGVVVLVAALAIIPLRMLQERGLRRSALAQARSNADKGDKLQAMKLLDNYLRSWPDDVDALALQGGLMAETNDASRLLPAAAVNDRLVRLDPDGPKGREARRRVVELYTRHGYAVLRDAENRSLVSEQAQELRFRAAVTLARRVVEDAPKDASAHRLLASALEGLVKSGDRTAEAEAIAELEKSLQLDPTDAVSAGRLARLYVEWKRDPAAADRVMDALLKAKPGSVETRVARYEIANLLGRKDQAQAEIAAAVALDPKSTSVRFVAAEDALNRHDTAAARAHLDAIPAAQFDSLPVRRLRGQIDFADQHPDQAVDQWRKGLSTVSGGDADLTFQLAYILLQLGRIPEVPPLIAQFQRLDTSEDQRNTRLLQAWLDERAGRPSRAIQELEPIRERVAKELQGELFLTLGRCYAAIGDERRALQAFRRAAQISPKDMGPRRAIARMIQASDPDGAISELERGLSSSPEDPYTLVELARAIANRQLTLPEGRRDWERPERLLGRAEELAPGNSAVMLARADLMASMGRLDDAVAMLGKATEGPNRSRPETWIAWAIGLARQGHADQALKVLERAEAPDAAGDHADLRIARARLMIQSGHGQAAKELLARAPDGVPAHERATLARGRGELLRQLGNREGARAAFAEWARLAPMDPQPGLTLVELGQAGDEEATRLGLEALRAIGGDEEPYGLAARAFALLPDPTPGRPTPPERLDQADRLIDKLQAVAPQFTLGHLLRGVVLERRQRPEEAIGEYKKALKANTQASAVARLVALYTRLKRYDELADLRKQVGAATVDPLSAAAAMKLGDKERAEQIAAQLVEGQPDSLQFRAAQAQLLRQLGKPFEAQETLRELTTRQPDQPGPWLALLLFQSGQKDKAGMKSTIERASKAYKGERPDLLIARMTWLSGEIDAAAKLFEGSLAQHPEDVLTLRSVAEFDEAVGRAGEAEAILRKALKQDPSASWAARWLALTLSGKADPAAWAEAWSLVAPGASGAGDQPEDRLVRATVLARSPEASRRDEAMPALVALAEDLPASSPIAIEARVRVGQANLDANRPAEAARLVLPAADDPSVPNAVALAVAVEALARSGKPDEALARLERLAEIEPKTPRTVAAGAWVAKAQGKPDEAVAAIESILPDLEKAPDGEGMSMAFYNLLIQMDRPEATERLARRIAEVWPRDSWILGRFLAGRGRYADALEACRVAAGAGSTSTALQVAIGMIDQVPRGSEILDQIGSFVESAQQKSPKDADLAVLLAAVRHVQGRYDEELALYSQALALNPSGVAFLNNMAWTLCEKGQPEEGLKQIEEAVRRVGIIAPFLDTRGVIQTRLGHPDLAIKDLEESARLDPSATTYYHLARAYLKAGRAEDHRRARDKAKEAGLDENKLDPGDRSDFASVMQP